MARGFRIHSSAVFNPFSYQELLAPIQDYQQAYNQMQEGLYAAGEEANQWQQYINADEAAGRTLREYNDTLSRMSSDLSQNGLKAINRNSLLNLRRTYNDKIRPINDAAKTLSGMYDNYRQMLSKDQTLMRGAMPTVSELVENPGATPHMVSGSSLYNQGAQAAKSASSRKQEFSARLNGIVRGYIDTVQRTGYNSQEALQFLNAASRQPELQEIFNQIYRANGVDMLENPSQGSEWILRGILDGMVYDQKNDLKYDQYAAEMRAAARNSAKTTTALTPNAFNLFSQKERNKARENIANYEKYFTEGATGWKLNDAGLTEIRKNQYSVPAGTSITGATQGAIPVGSGLRQTLEEYSGKPLTSAEDFADAWTRYYNEHKAETYDATKETGYRYQPQADDVTVLKRIIELSSREGKIPTVDYDMKKGKYVEQQHDDIKVDDLKKATVGNIEVSSKGITVDVSTGGKNDTRKVMLPKTNPVQYNNIISLVQNLHDIEDTMSYNALIKGYAGSPYEQNDLKTYIQSQSALYDAIAEMLRTINSKPYAL